ncbi:hypothetical protein J6590_101437 [Homalodisca vitripennis]|nr:hypothetical protein J6590_101437 [Homalodisca vitripennis]
MFIVIWCGFIAPNLLAPNLIPPTEKSRHLGAVILGAIRLGTVQRSTVRLGAVRLFQVSVSQHLTLCSKGALVGTEGMEENPTLRLTPLPTTRSLTQKFVHAYFSILVNKQTFYSTVKKTTFHGTASSPRSFKVTDTRLHKPANRGARLILRQGSRFVSLLHDFWIAVDV